MMRPPLRRQHVFGLLLGLLAILGLLLAGHAVLGQVPGGGRVGLAMKWGLPLPGKVISTWTADTITLEADAAIAAMVPEPLFNLVDLVASQKAA